MSCKDGAPYATSLAFPAVGRDLDADRLTTPFGALADVMVSVFPETLAFTLLSGEVNANCGKTPLASVRLTT